MKTADIKVGISETTIFRVNVSKADTSKTNATKTKRKLNTDENRFGKKTVVPKPSKNKNKSCYITLYQLQLSIKK